MGREHNVDDCIRILNRKQDIHFLQSGVIEILRSDKSAYDLGNKSWGRIDYLKSRGYRVVFVSKFNHNDRRIPLA